MLARGPDVLWRRARSGIIVQIGDATPLRLEPAASLLWAILDTPADRDGLPDRLASSGAPVPTPAQLEAAVAELLALGVLAER